MKKETLYYVCFVLVIIALAVYLYNHYATNLGIVKTITASGNAKYEAVPGINRDGISEHMIIKK
jgi:hypothetical protein